MSTSGKTLRVGVIGLGPIGNKHSDIYKSLAPVELVGVCDWNRRRADAAAARLGVPAYYDVGTMLRQARTKHTVLFRKDSTAAEAGVKAAKPAGARAAKSATPTIARKPSSRRSS